MFTRDCPICKTPHNYTTKRACDNAYKRNAICRSCHAKKTIIKFNKEHTGEKHFNYKGKAYTDEWKKNIINKTKGLKRNDKFRKNNSKLKIGHITSEETKRKISLKLKGRKLSDEWKEKIAASLQKAFQSNNWISKPELYFLNKIEMIFNLKINRQFRFKFKFFDGQYNNILIEVDGDYWHNNEKGIKNDNIKNNLAIKNGYNLVRIPFKDIKDIDDIINRNMEILTEIFNSNQNKLNWIKILK